MTLYYIVCGSSDIIAVYNAVRLKIAVFRRFKCSAYRNTLKTEKRLYGQNMSLKSMFNCSALPLCCADCMECACRVWSCAVPVSLCPVFRSGCLPCCFWSGGLIFRYVPIHFHTVKPQNLRSLQR